MPADRKGLNISLWDSTEDKDSNSLTDRNRVILKYLMMFYLLYSAECLILAVKSLIFCVLMDVPPSKLIKRHHICEESEY